MYDAWRSFFFGILDGVIALLGVIFFLQTGVPWLLAMTAFGILFAWNFVPVGERQVKLIYKVKDAQNGVALLGCVLPACVVFLALLMFSK